MMQNEFEALAGYEVSTEDYNNIIEPMYMATNMSKQEFVKVIDKKRFALTPLKQIVKEMKKCAESLKETCTHFTDWETKDRLESLTKEYISRKYNIAGARIAEYGINERMFASCFYPKSVTIYTTKNYQTIETIDLI